MLTENNPDAIISVVFATSNNIPADGTSTASVTAQVTDSAGAGLSGQSVVFTATAGAIIGSPVITDNSGLATTTLTSTTAGISSVTASVNSSTGHVDITFTEAAHSPVISSLISDKDSITNDGEDKATLVATVTDSKTSAPLSGVTVHWSSSQGTVTPASSVSNASGLAVAALADTGDTGVATVTASLDNGDSKTRDISVIRSDASWIISSLTSDKDSILNDGTDEATLTATVTDSNSGAPLSGVTVHWSTSLGTVIPTLSNSDSSGMAVTALTDIGDTGTATITALLGNGENKVLLLEIRTPATVTVRGGRRIKSYFGHYWSDLVAIDSVTGATSEALWQYEGEETYTISSRFTDPRPEKKLRVRTQENGHETILNPINIAGHYGNGAFATLTQFGNVIAWNGNSDNGGTVPSDIASRSDLKFLCSDDWGYSALTTAGSVLYWGNETFGRSLPSNIASRTDLTSLAGSYYGFATLTTLGGALSWAGKPDGSSYQAPSSISGRTDLVQIIASGNAFAALSNSGSVVAWGINYSSVVPSDIASRTDLISIVSNNDAFAALTRAGSVVAWGQYAKVPEEISNRTDLQELAAGRLTFAALTNSGNVVAWGHQSYGGLVPTEIALHSDLVAIAGNNCALAALTASGGVVAWGDASTGGNVPIEIATRNDLITLTANPYAFAALSSSGTVVVWGSEKYGGVIPTEIAPLLTEVVAIYSNAYGFLALKSDKTIVVWGGGANNMDTIPDLLQGNISYYQE